MNSIKLIPSEKRNGHYSLWYSTWFRYTNRKKYISHLNEISKKLNKIHHAMVKYDIDLNYAKGENRLQKKLALVESLVAIEYYLKYPTQVNQINMIRILQSYEFLIK